MPDLTDILIASLVLCVVAIGVLAYLLHRKGVPTAQLAKQTGLEIEGAIDPIVAKVLAALAKADANRGLRASYFDKANFYQALGTLPTSYVRAVRLDNKIERDGDSPSVDYVTDQATGNVVLK